MAVADDQPSSRAERSTRLPWEGDGPPHGVGICLSGGGLRAASFSMGAVQALQDERGLLFGKASADYLAVVSGGSYLGAAHILNASRLSRSFSHDKPPLAQGTGEARHLISNGSYLKSWSVAGQMGLSGVVNFLAFATLFAWAGLMLYIGGQVGIGHPSEWVLLALGALVFIVSGRIALRGLYLDGGVGRVLLPLVGAGLLLVTSPTALEAMDRVAPLSDTGWWTATRLPLALIACAAVVGVSVGLARVSPDGAGTRAAAWLTARLPASVGVVIFCLVATELAREMDRLLFGGSTLGDRLEGAALFSGVLFAAAVMQELASMSLHGMYRDSLARCFSVVRTADGVSAVGPTEQRLSDLAPPVPGQPGSFPRLLVCATANVVWNPADPERPSRLPSPKRRKYASFVYSHDRCGLPGVPNASFATRDLEKIMTRSGIRRGKGRREPVVSLMSAVASTGAAISPAMGSRTSELFRPVLAVSNLRLGRWLPNPLSARIRDDVRHEDADKRMRRRRTFGGGTYDEFVPELFGLHRCDAARVYISDGGHYDNLGLLALLEARCEEIWCVDAEADPDGKAGQLETAIKLAWTRLEVIISIDVDALPGPGPGVLRTAHVSGTIRYPDNTHGRIVVVKLGMTPDSDLSLYEARIEDEGFPRHGTFWPPWRVMWYGPRRFDSYRAMGYANAVCASQAHPQEVVDPTSGADLELAGARDSL